mgnify:FL=1
MADVIFLIYFLYANGSRVGLGTKALTHEFLVRQVLSREVGFLLRDLVLAIHVEVWSWHSAAVVVVVHWAEIVVVFIHLAILENRILHLSLLACLFVFLHLQSA